MATSTTFDILRGATETTEHWLGDLREEIGWVSERGAYLCLRSTLHALRDQMSVEDAARLGEALPVLIRGVFYEGWNPSAVPVTYVDYEAFLTRIRLGCRVEPGPDPEPAAKAVFSVLDKRLDAEEVEALKSGLPSEIRQLWP
ncbi:MAG: DUF2267 domain-containing protein [Planctomycetota bacterium]|jgi:uncharacterized protein (DUF2267 family)